MFIKNDIYTEKVEFNGWIFYLTENDFNTWNNLNQKERENIFNKTIFPNLPALPPKRKEE